MRYTILTRIAAVSLLQMACYAPSDTSGVNPNNSDDDFSLADLAGIDISDIAEIRFENLPAGFYDFEVTDAKLEEGTDKDGAKRFTATFTQKVLACHSVLEPGVDRESLVGKSHTETIYMNPGKGKEEMIKAIGRVRAYVSDIGGQNAGQLGPVVENTKGVRFSAKIAQRKDKDDPSVVYSRIKFDPSKKKA